MPDYSLKLYNSVLNGTSYIDNITGMVSDWRRSIRFMGGYWMGSFYIVDEPISVLQDFYYTQMGGHLIEEVGGGQRASRTWEGMIYEMDLTDDRGSPQLFVKVCGYIFTLNWRFVTTTTADDTTGNVSTYISDICTNHCEFVQNQDIDTNTLQVYRHVEIDQRSWDEIKRVTEMGDADGDIWRFYMDNLRTAKYEELDTTPRYYLRGGGIRRRSLDIMWNHVSGKYTDENGDIQDLGTSSNTDSISRYGQKEEKLTEHDQPQTAVEKLRDTFLGEHAWPWARAIGTLSSIELYDRSNSNMALNPWQVKPAVVRDMSYPVRRSEAGSSLTDVRDFIIDEVEVSSRRGLRFTSSMFEEAEILEAQEDAEMMRDSDRGRGGGNPGTHSEQRWKMLGISYEKWEKMTPKERRAMARKKGVKWW